MALALLAGHPLEVVHVGRVDGVADDAQVIDLRRFLATLQTNETIKQKLRDTVCLQLVFSLSRED